MPNLRALTLSFFTLSLLGCDSRQVALYVELRTDLVPGIEFSAVEVRVEDAGVVRETPALRVDDFLDGRRVADVTGLAPSDERRLTVRLLDGDRREVVRRTVQIQHRENRSVVVLITRSCRDVACPEGESCVAGACAPEGCEDDRGVCTDECATAGDCAPSPCGEPRCESRACVYAPREDVCAAGLYCDYERGCLPEPGGGPMDAGMPDAGVDAGPPPFALWSLPRGASEWTRVDTLGDAPTERVLAAFAPPGSGEIIGLTDTSVHVLRGSDLRWIERLDRDAVFPQIAGVAIWEASEVVGSSPLGLFVYGYQGAWQYEWDTASRSARFVLYTARDDFGPDWSDPMAAPYWTVHGVFADPDNADGWVTADPSAECPGRTRVGRYAAFVSTDGFGPAAMLVSIYDIDCLRFVEQGLYSSFPPFALPGAPEPFSVEAITRPDGLLVFTTP